MVHLVNGRVFPGKDGGNVSKDGGMVRRPTKFRGKIGASGCYPAESGRYHFYVSLACPWANRVLAVRAIKGLEKHISVSVVHPFMGDEHGWKFNPAEASAPNGENPQGQQETAQLTYDSSFPGSTRDHLFGATYLYEIYLKSDPHYTGNITVPVLFDKQTQTIVNNESAELIAMLNSGFDSILPQNSAGRLLDLYPADLRPLIDVLSDRIQAEVNNGVYLCGFAKTQKAYDQAFHSLFAALDWLEQTLGKRRYLCGDRLSLVDLRLFMTLVRFDRVYYTHFKCNKRLIAQYPHLSAYTRDIFQMPLASSIERTVGDTVDMQHIAYHYHWSHESINPHRIVTRGGETDFNAPHSRHKVRMLITDVMDLVAQQKTPTLTLLAS